MGLQRLLEQGSKNTRALIYITVRYASQ